MEDISYVVCALLIVAVVIMGNRLSKYNRFISDQEAARVIVADFLTRFAAWTHEPDHQQKVFTPEYAKVHAQFLAQAERFQVKSRSMVLSQHWCNDLADKFGVKHVTCN